MPRPGPSVTSGADLQPGSDSLFPSGFTGGGARPSAGSVGTSEIADGSVSGADLNLASVTAALNGTYAERHPELGRARFTPGILFGTPATMAAPPTITADQSVAQIASSVKHQTDSGDMLLLGPTALNNGSTYFRPAPVVGSTTQYRPWGIAFDLYGSKFEMRYSVKGANGQFRLKVDGQYANSTGTTLTNVSDGADKYMLIDFGSNGSRRIEFDLTGAVCVRWIATDVTSAVVPCAQNGPTALVVGDSYSLGYGVIGNGPPSVLGYAWRLRDLLGWGNLVIDGAPGTGYVHSLGGVGGYSTRLSDVAAQMTGSPDVVWVQGSINDDLDSASLQIAATTYLSSLKAQWPSAVVVASSVPNTVASGYGQRAGNSAKIGLAAAAAGAIFVDINTPTTVTGSGTSAAPSGAGNSDMFVSGDGVHPTTQGHEFLARLMATKALRTVATSKL